MVGDDAKLQKSAILRKAVDHIRHLRARNAKLEKQIALLTSNKPHNLKDLLQDDILSSKIDNFGSLTPPRSDESCPSSSPSYSDSSSQPPSPYEMGDSSMIKEENSFNDGDLMSSVRGMSSHGRLTLCMFMLAFLVVNPFKSFLSNQNGGVLEEGFNDELSSRKILSSSKMFYYETDFSWAKISASLVLWTVNWMIVTMCMVKMLIYGDPILANRSKAESEFWKHKKHSEVEFFKGNSSGAFSELKRCLQCYGLFLPTSRTECVTTTIWQFIRMLLHRVWIGRWLSSKAGGIFCSNQKRQSALNSAKELSLVYHRMNQIHLAANMPESYGLMMSLFSVNMAEAARSVMSPENMVDIYMTAALRVKKSYPKFLQFFCRYYLSKAKQESSILCGELPSKFQWAFTPYGYRFIVTHNFTYDSNSVAEESMFSSLGNKSEPLSYVMSEYCEHLLEKALQKLVGSAYLNSSDENANEQAQREEGYQIKEVLNYTQFILDSIVNESVSSINSCHNNRDCCQDRLAHWWSNLLTMSAYWLLGEETKAEELYSHIDNLPVEIKESSDNLPKAIWTVFRAKKALLNKEDIDVEGIIENCNLASRLLDDSLSSKKRPLKGIKLVS